MATNDYMYWKSCNSAKAQEMANNGVATVGISDSEIVMLAANDTDSDSPTISTNICNIDNISISETSTINYYSYSSGSTSDVGQVIPNGTYYINNYYTGKYAYYSASALEGKSGLISDLGATIRWIIIKVNGGYAIVSSSDSSKFLGVPTDTQENYAIPVSESIATLPDRCKWDLIIVSNTYRIRNKYNKKYLISSGNYLTTSDSIGAANTVQFYNRLWRIVSVSDYGTTEHYKYQELPENFYINNMIIEVGGAQKPPIVTNTPNALWSNASDFNYSISDADKISVDKLGRIVPSKRGVVSVIATHKVTRVSTSFEVYVQNSKISEMDYENLRDRFINLLGNGYAGLTGYSNKVEEAVNIVLEHDNTVTEYCNKYRIPKEFVQSVLFREIWYYNTLDSIADNAVQEYYAWKQGTGLKPLVEKNDCSTGLAQIFASTAINALNNAYAREFISLTKEYDDNNWQDVWYVWDKLHNNNTYNIKCCALVILDCQYEFDDTLSYYNFFDYSESQIKTILSRYNGYGDDATNYGNDCYNYFNIFKDYN